MTFLQHQPLRRHLRNSPAERNVDVDLVKGQLLSLCSLGVQNMSVFTLDERTNEKPILDLFLYQRRNVRETEYSEENATLFQKVQKPCPFPPHHDYSRDGHHQEKGRKKKSIQPAFWVVTGELSCESVLTTSDPLRIISSLPTGDFCSFPANQSGKHGFSLGDTLKANKNPSLQRK